MTSLFDIIRKLKYSFTNMRVSNFYKDNTFIILSCRNFCGFTLHKCLLLFLICCWLSCCHDSWTQISRNQWKIYHHYMYCFEEKLSYCRICDKKHFSVMILLVLQLLVSLACSWAFCGVLLSQCNPHLIQGNLYISLNK